MAEDWVELEKVSNETEAAMIRGLLETEGIPCRIESQKTPGLPVNVGDLAVIRILVPAEHLLQARNHLARREREFRTMASQGEGESLLTDSGPVRPEDDS